MSYIFFKENNLSGDAFKHGQFCSFHLRLVKSYLFVNELNNKDREQVNESSAVGEANERQDKPDAAAEESSVIILELDYFI